MGYLETMGGAALVAKCTAVGHAMEIVMPLQSHSGGKVLCRCAHCGITRTEKLSPSGFERCKNDAAQGTVQNLLKYQ